jgi:5'-deoxynucleotidase YfbR-like HD superfamily hydrolase
MRIYVELFGPPDKKLWVHMLYHDAMEIHTGDVPFYAKRKWPSLKKELDHAEVQAADEFNVHLPILTQAEIDECKLCDLLEMWEWGKEEVLMGNRLAHTIQADTWWAASELSEKLGVTEIVKKWMEEKQL